MQRRAWLLLGLLALAAAVGASKHKFEVHEKVRGRAALPALVRINASTQAAAEGARCCSPP